MISTFIGNLLLYLFASVFSWVSIWRYQLVTAGTGSEYYDAGCHLVEKGPYRAVLGQNRAELDISLWHWANIGP